MGSEIYYVYWELETSIRFCKILFGFPERITCHLGLPKVQMYHTLFLYWCSTISRIDLLQRNSNYWNVYRKQTAFTLSAIPCFAEGCCLRSIQVDKEHSFRLDQICNWREIQTQTEPCVSSKRLQQSEQWSCILAKQWRLEITKQCSSSLIHLFTKKHRHAFWHASHNCN